MSPSDTTNTRDSHLIYVSTHLYGRSNVREVQIGILLQRKLTAQHPNHKGRVTMPQISELLEYANEVRNL